MGQGPPGQERAPGRAAGTTASPREKDRLEQTAPRSDFPTLPDLRPYQRPNSGGRARLPGRDVSPPRAALGCPPCAELNLPSDTRPRRLAQALPPTSPRAFPESRSPIAPRCARRPYLRAQPQGTAIASAGPEVAVLRLLRAASPGRGGSGRAGGAVPAAELLRVARPPCAEAALVTPAGAGGRVCPEQWGEGGAGRGRSGAGTGERGQPRRHQGTRCWEGTGGRGAPGTPHVRGAAFPSPHPLPPVLAQAWIYPQRMRYVASSARNSSKLPEVHPHSWNCESAHFSGRTKGFRLRLGDLGDSAATASLTRTFEFSLNTGSYPSNPRPQAPHSVPRLHAAARISHLPSFWGPSPPRTSLETLAPPAGVRVTSAPRATVLLRPLQRHGSQACTPWRSRARCLPP